MSLHPSLGHCTTRSWQSKGAKLTKSSLIYPVFIHSHADLVVEIPAMPGQYRHGINTIKATFTPLIAKGLKCVLIFGVPSENIVKDNSGSAADGSESIVIMAIKKFKDLYPELLIACDVCLCAYTDHGHCGVLNDGLIDNQSSVRRIAEVSLKYAQAGCGLIAPSDMMDGRIASIKALLQQGGFCHIPVMSYSAKFASVFYGPFRLLIYDYRKASNSAPSKGDRKCYQLPPGARGLARRALVRDANEGADILIVKPGYPYLDIVRDASELIPDLPLAIYQVSGEYAMLWYGGQNGVFDLKDAVIESLESGLRAGANIFITYYTPSLLDWLEV